MTKKLSFDEFNKIGVLFSVYGELLTTKQRQILDLYFSYNLSLREIGENLNISSSAVHDALQKSVVKLQRYEDLLGLIRVSGSLNDLRQDIELNKLTMKEISERIGEIRDGI